MRNDVSVNDSEEQTYSQSILASTASSRGFIFNMKICQKSNNNNNEKNTHHDQRTLKFNKFFLSSKKADGQEKKHNNANRPMMNEDQSKNSCLKSIKTRRCFPSSLMKMTEFQGCSRRQSRIVAQTTLFPSTFDATSAQTRWKHKFENQRDKVTDLIQIDERNKCNEETGKR